MTYSKPHSSVFGPVLRWGAVAATAAVAYMAFEAQWVRCVEADLPVPGLPPAWSGLGVLHLSDVHPGPFPSNELSLRKAVDWALPLEPDVVILTGDILGHAGRSQNVLRTLARLEPPLGKFAVTGNHEFGLGKGPLAEARTTDRLWGKAGVTLLRDSCALLRQRNHVAIALCGADYLSGGYGLREVLPHLPETAFRILLSHEPPTPDSPLAQHFALAFAGHTHGGQLRVPSAHGLIPLNGEEGTHLGGVYRWGRGTLIVSRGIGASFVPLRLLTRPEATLWRLV